MLDFVNRARRTINDALVVQAGGGQGSTQNTLFWPVLSVLFGKRGPTPIGGQAGFWDTFKEVDALAVAAAGSATVWTPAAGNVVQLGRLQFWTSVAGSFQVFIGGVLATNEVTVINVDVVYQIDWPGFFCYPVNSVVTIKNNTAGAADIHASAFGTEVPA